MQHTLTVNLTSEDLRRLRKIHDFFPDLSCTEVYSLGIEEFYMMCCQMEDEEKTVKKNEQ